MKQHYLSVANLTVSAACAVLALKILHECGLNLNGSSAEVQGAMTVLIHWIFKLCGVEDKIDEQFEKELKEQEQQPEQEKPEEKA